MPVSEIPAHVSPVSESPAYVGLHTRGAEGFERRCGYSSASIQNPRILFSR
jgi:hypothetical protein